MERRRPRLEAENATVLLWMSLDSDLPDPEDPDASSTPQYLTVKEKWEDWAEAFFSKTGAKRVYVVDFSLLRGDFMSEFSSHALCKRLGKQILRVLTKFNMYDANLVAYEHSSCIAYKLLGQSDLLLERFNKLVLVNPTIPQKQNWFQYGRSEKMDVELAIFAETEERLDFVASQEFVQCSCQGENVKKILLGPKGEDSEEQIRDKVIDWLRDNVSAFDTEGAWEPPRGFDDDGGDSESDETYVTVFEVIFYMDRYSKQLAQRLLYCA